MQVDEQKWYKAKYQTGRAAILAVLDGHREPTKDEFEGIATLRYEERFSAKDLDKIVRIICPTAS